MPWKKKNEQFEIDANGNPIWIDDKDPAKEISVDGGKIPSLMSEAARNRQRAEAAEAAAAVFEGLDVGEARTAIDTLKKIDQKKLIDAGKVDEVRAEITATYQRQVEENQKKYETLQQNYNGEKLRNAFANSAWKEKLHIPEDIAFDYFSKNFSVDDKNRIVGKLNGQEIPSSKTFGQPADFDEALGAIIEAYPHRDKILIGANHGGSGSNGNAGFDGSKRTATRAEEATWNPDQRKAFSKDVAEGKAAYAD